MKVKTPQHGGAGGAKGTNCQERREKPTQTVTPSTGGRVTGLSRLHTAAKRNRLLQFNNLLHHITPELLLKAYQCLNRSAARGIDGESWKPQKLGERGTPANKNVVSQLLRELGFRRRKPQKKRTWKHHKHRYAQFKNIARLKQLIPY